MANADLTKAKRQKADEFYTQLVDIENEMRHYRPHFKGKTILCNCDDPYESNFFKYFAMNFNYLGLKKLIATCYDGSPIAGDELPLFDTPIETTERKQPYKIEITEVKDENGDGAVDLSDVEYLLRNRKNTLTTLNGNGDFRSDECVALLNEADIVVTNPPFSLFREYVALLVGHNKKFIIIGNQNAITYKEIFPLIKNNQLWLGVGFNNGNAYFRVTGKKKEDFANGVYDEKTQLVKFRNCKWFTNLDYPQRHEELTLYKSYNAEEFPKYDNYDAINVDKTADIPYDYDGVMGVPITFMDKYNPNQFEILGMCENEDLYNLKTRKYSTAECQEAYQEKFGKKGTYDLNASGVVIRNGLKEKVYQRVLIRRKDAVVK